MKKFKLLREKLPGFTMMDLLAGMVIMSIIVSMIFYLLMQTNQQISLFQNTRNKMITFNLLMSDISRQVEAANKIIKVPNGFKAVYSDKEIYYFQKQNYLIRNEGFKYDTLTSELDNIETFTVDIENKSEEMLNNIGINLYIGNKRLKLYIYKSYDRTEYINTKLLDGLKD